MRRMTFLKMLLVLTLCIGVLAFLRGWFVLSSDRPDNASNKVDVKLTVDPDKAREDTDKAAVKFTETVTEGAKNIGDRASDSLKHNQQPDSAR